MGAIEKKSVFDIRSVLTHSKIFEFRGPFS